jgi:hypothetical protein
VQGLLAAARSPHVASIALHDCIVQAKLQLASQRVDWRGVAQELRPSQRGANEQRQSPRFDFCYTRR